MRIAIEHQIDYSYSSPANYAIQHIRATPRSSNAQQVRRWWVVAGRQERLNQFFDCYGNIVLEAMQIEPHDAVQINISGVVETTATDGILAGQEEPLPLLYYMNESALTEINEDILDLATGVRVAVTKERIDGLHRLMADIGDALSYTYDQEQELRSATEALEEGGGASHAYAHVFVACARALEVPARFVNGYRLADGENDETAAEHSYAWAEAWVENLGWVGFDSVHQICPTESYVRVASGADHLSAQIIRGSLRGGGDQSETVTISVTPAPMQY